MSRTYKDSAKGSGRDRHISVRGVRRKRPDLPRMSRALIQLALQEAAAEAEEEVQEQEAAQTDSPPAADEAHHDSGAADD
jgi:hypothetical protein